MSLANQVFTILTTNSNPLPTCFALVQEAEDDLLLDFLSAIQVKLFCTAQDMVRSLQGSEQIIDWLQVQQRKHKAKAGSGQGVDFENILQEVKVVEEKIQKVI